MKLFIKNILIISLLSFGCILLVSIISYGIFHKNNKNFLASYELKVDRLETTKGKRRIVILGGSNVAFSINSQLLYDSLNIEVINAGLHGGIGLKNEVELFYSLLDKKNDIIIITPEFETLFNFRQDFESEEAVYCKSLRPFAFPQLNVLLYFIQRNNPVTYLKEIVVSRDLTIYHKDNFNKFGDISHYPTKRKYDMYLSPKTKGILFNERYRDAIAFIKYKFKDFNYFVASPVIHPIWPRDDLRLFDQSMRQDFEGRYILTSGQLSSQFDTTLFYNTIYHPNFKGKYLYSSNLIRAIKIKKLYL